MPSSARRPDLRDLPDLGKARSYWSKNRFREALRLFEKTARKHPNNVRALTDAARAFGNRFELEKANRFLERLERLAGKRADLLQLCGQSHRMIQQGSAAIRCLEKAAALDSALLDAHLELSILLERTHRLDEAFDHCQRCLDLKPGMPEAEMISGRILMRRENWGEARPLLERLAAAPHHNLIRTEALALLAQLHDRNGRYPEAFGCMTERASLLRGVAGPHRERAEFEEHHLGSLNESLDAEALACWTAGEQEVPVPVLLTGPPRSGTTLLMRMLDAHPELAAADEREILSGIVLPGMVEAIAPMPPAMEGAHLDGLPAHLPRKLGRQYRERLVECCEGNSDTRVLLDKNPSATLMAPVFFHANPGGKLIYVLRDPRDVILSCFFRHLPLNSVSVRFMDIESTAKRIRLELEAWLHLREVLPGGCWTEVRYEELVDDPEGESRRLLRFLDLPWAGEIETYRERNRDKIMRSPTYAEVSKPITRSAIGRWRHYESELKPALRILEPVCKRLAMR